MHLSMSSPRVGGGVGHRVGILTFSKRNYQNPHPWAKKSFSKLLETNVYFSFTIWNWKIKCMLCDENPHPGDTYIHILFYLVSYTSYIDIVPNKFTIWQFSNVNWWLARVFFSVDWILFLLYSYNSGTLQGRRDSSRVDWPIHITGEPMGLL